MPIESIPEAGKIAGWLLAARRLRDGDVFEFGRPDGSPHSGIHGSERAIDALDHATGTALARVSAWGAVLRADGLLHAEFVRVEWTADAGAGVNEFISHMRPELYGPAPCPLALARMAVRLKMAEPIAVAGKAKDIRGARKAEMDARLGEILAGLKPWG